MLLWAIYSIKQGMESCPPCLGDLIYSLRNLSIFWGRTMEMVHQLMCRISSQALTSRPWCKWNWSWKWITLGETILRFSCKARLLYLFKKKMKRQLDRFSGREENVNVGHIANSSCLENTYENILKYSRLITMKSFMWDGKHVA